MRFQRFFTWLAEESTLEELSFYIAMEEQVDGRFDDVIALAQLGMTGDMKLALAENSGTKWAWVRYPKCIPCCSVNPQQHCTNSSAPRPAFTSAGGGPEERQSAADVRTTAPVLTLVYWAHWRFLNTLRPTGSPEQSRPCVVCTCPKTSSITTTCI